MTQEKEQAIIQRLREVLAGISIHEVQVEKNNQKKLGGIRVGKTGEALGIAVYWDEMEQKLGEDFTVDTAVEYIRLKMRQYLGNIFSYEKIRDWQMAKRKIYKKLVNYEKNAERLEKGGIVYRKYLDLAEVCYLQIRLPVGSGSAEITEELLKIWGVSGEEAFMQAEQNMERERYYMVNIADLIGRRECPGLIPMYVVLNGEQNFGASILAAPNSLKRVLEDRDADYYILPSSIHELILCPADSEVDVENLRRTVFEVNRSVWVSETNFLSDNVYYYSASAGEIRML